jgi:GWxTD domain-containing protein
MEEKRWLAAETALAATGGKLMHRIVRQLNRAEGRRPAVMPVAGAAALLMLAAGMVFAWHFQAEPATPAATRRNEVLGSPYEKWVKEDVVYVITLAERKAYQELTTDDERAHFVQQFWERRDPTPGTARNEFRDEHYRRIAYANQRFPGTNMPGWRTDRGRTYIMFGPPDEIESHPAGEPFPYEVWRYWYLEGIGSDLRAWFVDPQLTGDYRLAPAPRR